LRARGHHHHKGQARPECDVTSSFPFRCSLPLVVHRGRDSCRPGPSRKIDRSLFLVAMTDHYLTLVHELFGEKPGNGYTRDELAAAESQLGFPLPQVLAEHYLAFGKCAFN